MTKTKRQAASLDHVPTRVQAAVYATGTFANTSTNVASVLLPLWALAIGASPLMIGLILGARHVLTALLSIHGGALMDRLGTRRVLIWFGAVAAIVPLLFPIMPWIWAAILLQMISGLASNYGWMGAQAEVGEAMKGNPTYAGRLGFCIRIGQLAAAPLAGLSWDLGGPWGGFCVLALWGVGLFFSSLALPRHQTTEAMGTGRLELGELVPRVRDYADAFKLLAIPAILLVVMITVMRMGGSGIQSSFYVVYLEGVGYSGTEIGLLLGAAGFLGLGGSLAAGPMARVFRPYWLLICAVIATILFVAITPLIGASFVLLLIASSLRGGALGLSQPLMLSMLAIAAGAGRQGKSVALRTTANRLVSLAVPVVMGAVIEFTSLETAFYVVGGALVVMMGAVALYVRRSPSFAS